jgi:molybdate transport system substrate-binding protein
MNKPVNTASRLVFAGAVSVALITGCSSQQNTSSAPTETSSSATSAPSGEKIVVFAAAAQNKAFTEIGEAFKTDNPGSDVEFTFASSADQVTQLTQGAAADVFASADTSNMDKVVKAGLVAGTPANFASNTLTIAVAPGNPKKITSLADLNKPGISVVVCVPQAPCGAATQKAEQAAGVRLNPVSEEPSVAEVLSKVESGPADAGLVYMTDVLGAGDKVTGVPFPEAAGAATTDSIAVLKQAKNSELAGKFVELVTGEAGQKILAANGFTKP